MDNALIGIIRDHLLQRKTENRTDYDWDELFALSKRHEVTGIVYYQCKGFIPEKWHDEFERHCAAALYFYPNRVRILGAVSTLLAENGIPFFSVKGLEVARYYPVPGLRTMGDLDVVVEPGRLEEAVDVLKAHGFVQSPDPDDSGVHVWSCDYKGMHFEFHDRLTDGGSRAEEQIAFFGNYMPYVKDNALDWNYHFLFLLLHLRKHFMNSGVGLRQFMDVAVIAKNRKDLDWAWIEDRLRELKLKRFAHVCYSLIEDWFEIKIPAQYEKLGSDATAEITEKILKNGVFGAADEDNRNNRAGNFLAKSRGSLLISRFVYLVQSLFPSYKEIKFYSGCGFLDGRPYLLPLAWIRRFAYILRSENNENRKRTIQSAFQPESEIEKRRALLEKMGLLDD